MAQPLLSYMREFFEGAAWATAAMGAASMLPVVGWIGELLGKREEAGLPGGGRASPGQRIQHLEHELERLRDVIRKSASLNATLDYERVLSMVQDLSASAIANGAAEDAHLMSALLLFHDNQLVVETARGLSQADLRVSLPGESGLLGNSLASGGMQLTENVAQDPELQRFTAVHQCRAAVTIPLIAGMEAYGVLLFAHPRPAYFNAERLELLEAVSQQAVIALQNARLYRELEQEKERIAESQEEARHKLARDLHDGPTQSIGAIAMRVNFARRLMERDPKAAADELFKIEELARRTTKEIRQMLFTLRPLVLETQGLVPALQHLAAKMKETHAQEVMVEAGMGVAEGLEIGKQGVLFFIAEEAANNARKHARAPHIWIRLTREGDFIRLDVADDGVGFDVQAVESNYEQRGSLGMLNLRERAELVSGLLRIDSAKGRGTRVSVTVPLTVEAAERLHRPGFRG
jgi:signal transduction histidine kinase